MKVFLVEEIMRLRVGELWRLHVVHNYISVILIECKCSLCTSHLMCWDLDAKHAVHTLPCTMEVVLRC